MFECISETYGTGEPYASVEEFLDMCAACFGERPELREGDPGEWHLVGDDNALGSVVLVELRGTLHDYATGEDLRPATLAEYRASMAAGETGAFEVNGRVCYVVES